MMDVYIVFNKLMEMVFWYRSNRNSKLIGYTLSLLGFFHAFVIAVSHSLRHVSLLQSSFSRRAAESQFDSIILNSSFLPGPPKNQLYTATALSPCFSLSAAVPQLLGHIPCISPATVGDRVGGFHIQRAS